MRSPHRIIPPRIVERVRLCRFYEYECPTCRYYLEVLQKLSDKPAEENVQLMRQVAASSA